MEKYGAFDLGNGLIISLNPENHKDDIRVMIPNVFIVQNQIGRLDAPLHTLSSEDWHLDWLRVKKFSKKIVDSLNDGSLTEEKASLLMEAFNDELKGVSK